MFLLVYGGSEQVEAQGMYNLTDRHKIELESFGRFMVY